MTMSRRIRLRYPAVCAACDAELQAGVEASWNSQRRTATCVRRVSAVQAPVIGSAGASARAEAERRRTRQRERHDKIKQAHPVLGRIALAVLPEPDAGRSWETGVLGEERLGRFLDAIATDTVLLHDRRIPGTKANIDHIVVAANGVWIVDAKRYKGKVEKRDVGGWFRTDLRLYVGGRDRSKLIDGVRRQVDLVHGALEGLDLPAPPVTGALCFVEGDWPLFAKPFTLQEVVVTWPKDIRKTIQLPGTLEATARQAIHRRLADHFPAAA